MYIHMYIHVHMCIYMRRSISLSAAGYILRLPFERESLAHIVINIIIRYKKEGLRWIARALREGGAAVMAAGGPQVSRCTYIHTCIEIHR